MGMSVAVSSTDQGREHVPGMPDDLAEAVYRVLDADGQTSALATWSALTEDLRKAYRSYVDAPGWTRWHRWRCDQAAYTLSAGGRGPGAPNPLARWSRNLLATVGAVVGGGMPRWLQDKIADEDERNRLV